MLENQLLALVGLCSGVLLGLAARLGNFCTLGSISDILKAGHYTRALIWPAAIGWTMVFISIAIWFDFFNIEAAYYFKFKPNYLAHIFGGLAFGFGMALAGMCGFTGLLRVGSGDLRALYALLIIGITSYVAMDGPLANLRQTYLPFHPLEISDAIPSFAQLISNGSNVPIGGVLALIGMALIILPMLHMNFRSSYSSFWAMSIGFAIASAWVGTMSVALISYDLVSIQSHSFSASIGDSIIYIMSSSKNFVRFEIGGVFGVILGGTIGSLIKNDFKWEICNESRELHHIAFGATLMGIGGVVAFGCSIGQGISAMSVLSYGAPITIAAIVFGAYIGLKIQNKG